MPATVTPEQRQAAKREIVRDIEQGVSAHEHASGLLLLAAANETGLIAHLTDALPPEQKEGRPPLMGSSMAVRQRLVFTLLFLEAVGLHRTWDLRSYTADGLALLTGRKQA